MSNSQFIRQNGDFVRFFYTQQGQNWLLTKFDSLKQGDRFFFVENNKRSPVRIVRQQPQYHAKYKCFAVEAIPAYTMEPTATLRDISKKADMMGGMRPVYVRIDDEVVVVSQISLGAHGEIFLHTERKDLPHVKYYDDLPAVMAIERKEVVTEVEFVENTNVPGADTAVHRSTAA